MERQNWKTESRSAGAFPVGRAVGWATCAGIGCAAAFLRFGSGFSPFAAALAAVLPGGFGIAAALGAGLGAALQLTDLYAAAVLISLGLVLSAKPFFVRRLEGWLPVWAGVASVAASLLVNPSGGTGIFPILSAVFAGLLTVGAALLVRPAAPLCSVGLPAIGNAPTRLAVLSSVFIVCGAFGEWGFGGLAAGRVLAVAVCLIFMRDEQPGQAALCGALGGLLLSAANGAVMTLSPALALGCLVCASVRRGAGWKALAFFGSSFVVLMVFSENYDGLLCIYELGLAALLSTAMPLSLYARMRTKLTRDRAQTGLKLDSRGAAAASLSAALGQVGRDLDEANTKLLRLSGRHGTEDLIVRTVCRHCRKNGVCWSGEYGETASRLGELLQRVCESGEKAVPDELPDGCPGRERICELVNRSVTGQMAPDKLISRRLAVMQFELMSELLLCSNDSKNEAVADENAQSRILRALGRQGDSMTVEVSRCGGKTEAVIRSSVPPDAEQLKRIVEVVGEGGKRGCAQPKTRRAAGGFTTVVTALPTLESRHALVQRGVEDGCCGDACIVSENGGEAIYVLSDGMGTGGEAAVDATMAAGIFMRLYTAGAAASVALKCANSALMARAGNESLATLDILIVDRYAGTARLIKAGACPTLLLRDGTVRCFEGGELPIGIIGRPECDSRILRLVRGDVLLLFSDGAGEAGALSERLRELRSGESLQDFCEALAQERINALGAAADDITVLAVEVV